MSKYDELNFKSFSEKQASSLSKEAEQIKDNEIISQLDNFQISSIQEMMHLSPKEYNYYTHINNNQEKIAKDYLTKCTLFSQCITTNSHLTFFINMLKKEHGTIINGKIFKQFIELFTIDQIPQLTLRDYERLFMLNFCKDNINLNNENDYNCFITLISNLIN